MGPVPAEATETRADSRLPGVGPIQAAAGSGAPPAGEASGIHGQFLPGTPIAGRYRIVSLVGRGGMGEVYRADDLKLGQPVALKFLPPGPVSGAPHLEYLLREVRLARQVAHPQVCRVHDVGEVNGQHFLSMEYIDGEDLRGLLRRIGRLPTDKGIQIAKQLCAGLAAAHERGVIHRDLKPANIMLDSRGNIRITDFGLALSTDAASDGGRREGTPAYMAPEQRLRGETSVRSDLYALGLILYEVFAGRRPCLGVSGGGAGGDGDLPPMPPPATGAPDMDPIVERVVLRCLETDPARRPASARAVAAGLPGGDLLEAALAAGETPSPELVAASGDDRVLGRRAAGGWLAAALGALLLVWVLAQPSYLVNRDGPGRHPEALAEDARRMLVALGLTNAPADRAFGFLPAGGDVVRFWYRESPQALVEEGHWGPDSESAIKGIVTVTNPVPMRFGESEIRLSQAGSLVRFRTLPVPGPGRGTDPGTAPWSTWFSRDRIGFELDSLSVVEDLGIPPPSGCDALRVWKGTPARSTNEVVVQAAAYRQRPVYFEVFDAAHFEALMEVPVNGIPRTVLGMYAIQGAVIALMVVACVLAWRNVRSRRGDPRGARRVAAAQAVVGSATWIVGAHHTFGIAELGVFINGMSEVLFLSATLWVWYTAMEPFVRRLWPRTLIGWTRLIDGRWRDSLVGREILLGCFLAAAGTVLIQLGVLAPGWLGLPVQAPLRVFGVVSIAVPILSVLFGTLPVALFTLLSLLLLRWTFRRPALAAAAFVVFHGTTWQLSMDGHPMLGWIVWLGIAGLALWALVGNGFLAFVVFWFVGHILVLPLTTNPNAWYFGSGLVVLAVCAGLAAFGWWASQDPLRREPTIPDFEGANRLRA